MAAKVPIRAVFDGSTATGLAEFQSAEFIALAHGGLGAALTIGSAGQVLKVNDAGNAVEFATAASADPASADGDSLGTASAEWSDLYLADGGVIYLGNDQDVTLTHVADTGILLNGTMAIQFNDSSQYINAPSNAILDINATDEIELNATLVDVNANLDVSGTGTIAGAVTTAALTASGILKTDDTTEATSTTDGSLQTDGGLSVAKDVVAGDDVKLLSDSAVLSFGADSEVTLTHVHNDGLLLNSDNQLQFRDSAINIRSDADGVLDINADDEIELNSTLIDINGNVDVSGTYTGAGVMTTGGNIVIPNAGNIGSVGDTDSIAIDSSGNITASQNLTVTGDFTVNGTTTTVATTNMVVKDNMIELNNGATSNANDSGLVIERGSTGDNAIIHWDESADKFQVGTTTATGSSTGNLTVTTGTLVANVEGSGAGLTAGTTPLTTLDIDGGTDIGAALSATDLIIVDDGAGGTNRKAALSRVTTLTDSSATALAIALG